MLSRDALNVKASVDTHNNNNQEFIWFSLSFILLFQGKKNIFSMEKTEFFLSPLAIH